MTKPSWQAGITGDGVQLFSRDPGMANSRLASRGKA